MLRRFFMNFYDMEIIEEEAFLKWKEDINDEYPGKGKALFQVTFLFFKFYFFKLLIDLIYIFWFLFKLSVITPSLLFAGKSMVDMAWAGRGGIRRWWWWRLSSVDDGSAEFCLL